VRLGKVFYGWVKLGFGTFYKICLVRLGQIMLR